MTNYKVTLTVQDEPGVLARTTVLLRKFNINISSMEVHPLNQGNNFSDMVMKMETDKDTSGFKTVIKKLKNLVPVVKVVYEKI